MKPEPRYIEDGEEFDDEDTSWRYTNDFIDIDMINTVFRICGNRKYFRSPKEAKIWRKIDNQIAKGMIPTEWINFCIAWATEKNAVICAIKVEALGHFVLNKARMQDWLGENKDKMRKASDY